MAAGTEISRSLCLRLTMMMPVTAEACAMLDRAMIGSGLAGLVCGLNGVMANGIGVGGLPGILSIQPAFWQVFALAMAVAIIIPMALTTVVYQRKFRQGTLQIV